MTSNYPFLPQAISVSTKSPSSLTSNSVRFLFVFALFSALVFSVKTEAQLASQFSLSVGEEFNDNIFFSKQREHDFITNISPTFRLLYQPSESTPGSSERIFKFYFTPTGQIFARNPENNNFGENLSMGGDVTYAYSPRLTFFVIDTFRLRGDTRTVGGGGEAFFQTPGTPTGPPVGGLSGSQSAGDFVSNGNTLSNYLTLQGDYLLSPMITIIGRYTSDYTSFFDEGGSEFSNTIGIRGSYRWQQEHNLNAGYSIGFYRSRNGENNVIHTFNLGDDFFSRRLIQLTPTLTLSGATGISLNTANNGPRVANNTSLTLIKLWERASLSGGVRKRLTSSFGVSGISDTLTLFTSFNARITEQLSATALIDYSRYDTDDDDFDTLQAVANLKYAITSWLCSSILYSHRRRASDDRSSNSNFHSRGNAYGNSVLLTFSTNFDLWPTFGKTRGQGACGVGAPSLAPQLPQRTSQ